MNEGWLAVCHRQTTWAGPVVHSQSVWQSCDGGMRDDSGCSSQLHHKVRYAFVRQARHRTARTHARFVGSSRNRHRHSENEGTSHNVSSYLRNTNILMISMPEGEVNSQRTTSAVFHPEYNTSTIVFRRSTFAPWAVHQCTAV